MDCVEQPRCADDDDCNGARICVHEACYDCWGGELAACTGEQMCTREGTCRERTVCSEDDDCLGARVCTEASICGQPDPCDADALEPNDLPDVARRIGGVRRDLWACSNADWYKMRVRRKGLIVLLRRSDELEDPEIDPYAGVEFALFDQTGRQLLATGKPSEEHPGALVVGALGQPVGEDVTLLVRSFEPMVYDLSVKHDDRFCPPLDTEPNNEPEHAGDVTLGVELEGSLCAIAGEAEDRDHYRLALRAGQRVGFDVSQTGAELLEVALVDGEGRVLGAPSNITEGHGRGLLPAVPQEVLDANPALFVRLRGIGATYRLRLAVFTPSDACADDDQEPDDLPLFASLISDQGLSGVLCPGSVDHLAIDAQQGDGLRLAIEESDGRAASWRLMIPGGGTLNLVRNGDRLSLVEERLPVSGRYVLIAVGGRTRSRYSVTRELVAGGVCEPDGADPDDDEREGAAVLTRSVTFAVRTACDDPDWYRFEVPEGERSGRVRIRPFGSQRGPLNVEVFADQADLPLASTSANGAADLEFAAPGSGTYYVRVTGDVHVTTRYQLLLVGPAPGHDTCVNPGVIRDLIPGQPQTFEASNAGAHHSTESACGGAGAPDVQYLVRVPDGGAVVTFDLESLYVGSRRADHLISLSRFCGSDELYCDNNGVRYGHERLVVDLDPGIYALSVDGTSSFADGGSYRLIVTTTGPETRAPFVDAADGCAANLPAIPLPEDERGTSILRSTAEGLSDSTRGSCSFNIESADAFFSLTLTRPARVNFSVPHAGRSTLFVRTAACHLPVDLACNQEWSGGNDLSVGVLPAGTYTVVVDRMDEGGRPFRLLTTLVDP
jgi:hypothetical protein